MSISIITATAIHNMRTAMTTRTLGRWVTSNLYTNSGRKFIARTFMFFYSNHRTIHKLLREKFVFASCFNQIVLCNFRQMITENLKKIIAESTFERKDSIICVIQCTYMVLYFTNSIKQSHHSASIHYFQLQQCGTKLCQAKNFSQPKPQIFTIMYIEQRELAGLTRHNIILHRTISIINYLHILLICMRSCIRFT